MSAIEEAYRPFAELNRRMGKARAQDAARQVALAVSWNTRTRCSGCSGERMSEPCDYHQALDAKLEAL